MPKDYGTPGPRAIYPDAVRSSSLAALSADAERLFWRLIAQADDQGRLEGEPVQIQAFCLPRIRGTTLRKVEGLLDELEQQRLIVRYRADGFHLLQLVTWWRWQGGARRAYPSKWPPPEGWSDAVYGLGESWPKTYRDAVDLPKGARRLPSEMQQGARELPQAAGSLHASRAGAQPVPVPSAGAGAGAGANGGENPESVPFGNRAPDGKGLPKPSAGVVR